MGKIVSTQGLKGEMRVYSYTDYKERFEEEKGIYIKDKFYEIEKVRYKKEMVILKLKDINSIEEVEKLRNQEVFTTRKAELPEGTYYIKDLIGVDVFLEDETKVGQIKDVLITGANDVYIIKRENKPDAMIPVVDEFVSTINIKDRKIVIKPIEGML